VRKLLLLVVQVVTAGALQLAHVAKRRHFGAVRHAQLGNGMSVFGIPPEPHVVPIKRQLEALKACTQAGVTHNKQAVARGECLSCESGVQQARTING